MDLTVYIFLFQQLRQYNCLTGNDFALITIDSRGDVNMNSGKAFIYKKEDILNVVNSQKTEMKNVNFQCNLTPKSSVASWTDTDVDRNLGDKLLGPRPDALNKISNFGSN